VAPWQSCQLLRTRPRLPFDSRFSPSRSRCEFPRVLVRRSDDSRDQDRTFDFSDTTGLQSAASTQLAGILATSRVGTNGNRGQGLRKAITKGDPSRGLKRRPLLRTLSPAQTQLQLRTHILSGTANGGTSSPAGFLRQAAANPTLPDPTISRLLRA